MLKKGASGGIYIHPWDIHHSFHYYGMSRTYQLEWIGQARQAWE